MTPGEYKNGGENLAIHYSFAESPFGEIFVASTDKGICCLEFTDNHPVSIDNLKRKFPNAKYKQIVDELQQNALFIFTQDWSKLKEIKLHLKGTDFQLKVWEALLKIPMGGLTTYGDIAAGINHPKACRAVGTAVGENPVALLIPCHRVIRSTGELGNYHWGDVRKSAKPPLSGGKRPNRNICVKNRKHEEKIRRGKLPNKAMKTSFPPIFSLRIVDICVSLA